VRHSRVLTVCLLVLVAMALPATASASPARAQASSSMVAKINSARARNGLRPLRRSRALNASASRFAGSLLRRGVLAHRSSGVSAGSGFRRLGEALALISGRGPGVSSTVTMWLNSPSHRAVILTRSMNLIGVGMASGRFRGRRATIWVVQTGRR
jgi:uncharacterized protein YkwD